MSTIEGLKPFVLLGGYNAAELWPTINLITPTWLLLAVAPRWEWTPALTLVGPVFFAAMYALSATSLMLFGGDGATDIDFSSLEGIVNLFRDPNGVFVGWIHYVAYDALIGRWIALDAAARGCSLSMHAVAVVPCLFLALMFGPMGWLLYLAVVRPFLPGAAASDTNPREKKNV